MDLADSLLLQQDIVKTFLFANEICHPSCIMVSDADCYAVGPGFEFRGTNGFLKCTVPVSHEVTLNSRRSASPLVKLLKGEDRGKAPDHPRVFSLKIKMEPC
ncbi:hypothetical protein TNCV_3164471 [Trichonephila clavipes]|nr:hypothetical protein TNCV_3164471 [Trichonephila clavipes]